MLVTARYGEMRYVADFTCDVAGVRRGTRCVLTTDRGTELGEILVTNKERPMSSRPRGEGERRSEYDKPGISGHVLRVATPADLEEARRLRLEDEAREYDYCAAKIAEQKLKMQLVCAEHLLGGEKVVFYFLSDERIDFRDLVKDLQGHFRARIELRQIGARDSARLVGDYNTCGQQLCCQTFIKDFEPITMKMAKTQRTTLDPEKISGRCGKLKCCLRYENDVYIELKKLLPNIGAKVKTKKGPGEIVDQNVIAQEVMLQLESGEWIRCWGSDVLEVLTPGNADAPPKRRPRLPPPGSDDDKRGERGGVRRDKPGARGAVTAAGAGASAAPGAGSQGGPVSGTAPATAPGEPGGEREGMANTGRTPRGGGQSPDVLKPGSVDVDRIAAELAKGPLPAPERPVGPARGEAGREGRRWDRGERDRRGSRPPAGGSPPTGSGGGGRPEGAPGSDLSRRPEGGPRAGGEPRQRWQERRDRGRPGRPQQGAGGAPGGSSPRGQTPPPAGSAPAGAPPGTGGTPPDAGAPAQRSIREHRRRRGGRGRRHGGKPPSGGAPPAGGTHPPAPSPPPPPGVS